jgi:hypothetical protein
MSECRGTHVAYSLAMLGGRIDRDAWAEEINALIVRFDPGPRGHGNKSAFARRVGLTTKTLERWANRATEISTESARQVLDSLGLPQSEQIELLTRVGYVEAGAMSFAVHHAVEPAVPDPYKDDVIRQILNDPGLTERQRAELVQIQIERIDADLQRRREEYKHLRRLFGQDQAS